MAEESSVSQTSVGGVGTSARETSLKSNLASTLQANVIGTFKIPLKNITCTSHVRQVNERGIKTVLESIQKKGWLDHCAPAVVIEREVLEGGEFTDESALARDFQVLDGNHRITAARRLWGGEHLVSCRVHFALPASVIKIVADREYFHTLVVLLSAVVFALNVLFFKLAQVYPILRAHT